MINNKHINKIITGAVALALIFCSLMVYAAGARDTINTPEYQKRLFNGEPAIIDIQTDADEWKSLLDNASQKAYISADVTINGEIFGSVGIRTKGNSSLSQISMSDNARYSLNFKMDEYVKGQTYYGLDVFCVNNMTGDATYMKEYISYDIMRFIGAGAPLVNYATVTVNNEYYGFGILLERYEQAFIERVFNTSAGNLYNVKIQMGQRDNFIEFGRAIETDENQAMQRNGNGGDTRLGEGSAGNGAAGADGVIIGENGENRVGGGDAGNGIMGAGGFVSVNFSRGGAGGVDSSVGISNADDMGSVGAGGDAGDESDGNTGGGGAGDVGGRGMNGFGAGDAGGRGMGGGGAGGRGMGGFGGSNGGSLAYTDDELSSYSAIFDNAAFGRTNENDMQRVVAAIKKLNEGDELEQYWDVDGALRYFAAHTFVVNLDSYISNMQQNYYLYEKDGQIKILPWDYNLAFGGFMSGSASDIVNFPIDTPVSGVNMEDRPLLNELLKIPEYRDSYHRYLLEIVEGYFNSGRLENTVRDLDAKIGGHIKNDTGAFFTPEQYEASIPEFIELCLLRAKSVAGQLDGTIPSTTAGQNAESSALIDASGVNASALGSMMGGGGRGMGGDGGGFGGMDRGDVNFDGGGMGGNRPNNMRGRGNQGGFIFPDGMPGNFEDFPDEQGGFVFQRPDMQGAANQGGADFPNMRDISAIPVNETDNSANWLIFGCAMALLVAGTFFMIFYKRGKLTV